MKIKHLTIIIPTFNEEENIVSTLKNLELALNKLKLAYNLLVFDSQSTDDTIIKVAAYQKTHKHVILKSETHKSGLGSAYHQAFQWVLAYLPETDVIFEYDADGSHQPQYIEPMLKAIEQVDCVIGSRYINGGSVDVDWPLHRVLLSKGAAKLCQWLWGNEIKDYTSGYKATRSSRLMQLDFNQLKEKDYAYKLEMIAQLKKHHATFKEIPIEFVDRSRGISKMPFFTIYHCLRALVAGLKHV